MTMAVAVTATVVAGFGPTYYFWPMTHVTAYPTGLPVKPFLPTAIHLHAGLFSLWLLLLVVQATLVTSGRRELHRRLGLTAVCLVPLMVVTGVMTAIRGGRDGWNPGGPYPDAMGFMVVGFADIATFTTLTAAGFMVRRRSALHKRLMLLGTLGGLTWPAITRMPLVAGKPIVMFGLLGALVLALPIRDFVVRSSWRMVSLWCALAILLTFPIRVAIGNSVWWHAFAVWLTSR